MRVLPLSSILPEVHPPSPAVDERGAGLEATELMTVAPGGMPLEDVLRALVVAELEAMTGFRSAPDGTPLDSDGWRSAEVSSS